MDLGARFRAELEELTLRRLPAAMALLLVFLVGALPVELKYYPDHLGPYAVVYAVECLLSAVCFVVTRRHPGRARLVSTCWASGMGLLVASYYPLVGNDATIALAALICLVATIPAVLPFDVAQQLVFGSVCALGFFGVLLLGVPVSLPWLYGFVAFLAVLSATAAGARAQTTFRRDAFRRETWLRAAEEQLRTALARAESAVALRSRLVANVSHELRTPVNVIVGYADMLLDPALSPAEVGRLATRIREYGVTLESLVSGLLDLSRLSCGKVDLAIADVDAAALLAEVAQGARMLLKQKPVEVVVACDVVSFRSDPGRVRQILTNLVGNAVKFTSCGTITLGAHAARDWLTLTVRDTGCGVPADKLDTIFTAFEQLRPGREAGGIGLGLAIVRQLTDVLGGTVAVASTPDAGTTFTVTLPGPVVTRTNATAA